jgi:ATPase subunit of ABC transporter with duplicated ATPase domains
MNKEIALKEETKTAVNNAVQQANALVVTNNEENTLATTFIKNVKSLIKEIGVELDPGIKKANELHKHLTQQKKRILEPLQAAEQTAKLIVSRFLTEQEKIRKEEERKEREKAEAAEKKRKEELLKQAENHEAKGNTEKAEERRQQAEETYIPAPVIESKVAKQEGVSTIQKWTFEIVNKSLIPIGFMKPDEVAIGGVVRALKNKEKAEQTIPGIRVRCESSVSVKV